MLRYNFSDDALEVARLCGDAMAELAEIIQSALDAAFDDHSDAAAPIERDRLELLSRDRKHHERRLDLYTNWVLLSAVTRCNHMMDSLLGMHVLARGTVEHGLPTALAPSVLARTVLETGVTAAHHLNGTLEDRLIRGYVAQLNEYVEAIRAGRTSPIASASDLADLEHEYLKYRALHAELGYTLVPNTKASPVAGQAAVKSVQTKDGKIRVQLRTQTTDRVAKEGISWLQSWRLGSGINHGLIWAIQAEYQRLERGDTRGEVFLAAAASAIQGCLTLLSALSVFTGNPEPLRAADNLVGGLRETFSAMGFPATPDPTS